MHELLGLLKNNDLALLRRPRSSCIILYISVSVNICEECNNNLIKARPGCIQSYQPSEPPEHDPLPPPKISQKQIGPLYFPCRESTAYVDCWYPNSPCTQITFNCIPFRSISASTYQHVPYKNLQDFSLATNI